MARLPQPPTAINNETLHRSLTDVINFMRETYDLGLKQQGFTQTQIDSFTDSSFLGTILFNTTTNASNVSFLDSGVVKWREV